MKPTIYADEKVTVMDEIELSVEEVEEVVAPQGIIVQGPLNHNETLVAEAEQIELCVEEVEEVIAPGGIIVDGPRP